MTRRFVARPLYVPESEELRFLPECPRVLGNYPGCDPVLGWVSIQHAADRQTGSLNLLNLATLSNRSIDLPGRPGFFVETTRPGTLLVGMERRLVLLDLATGKLEETGIRIPDDDRVIINDGIAIPGGLLFGTKHLEFNQTIAALYHYDAAARKLRELIPRQICSNGKFFQSSETEATLIDIDSLPRTISRYRFDRGLERLIEHSLVTPPGALPSLPDGLRATPGGASIVVAYYNPGLVSTGLAQEIRLADGAVLAEWELPGSPRVTCPEFARLDGKVSLIFSTAVEGMTPEHRGLAPYAGALFCAETTFDELPPPLPLFPLD